jgi:guanylate kinase
MPECAMTREKKIIILCGPSGSGKTTIAQHLLSEVPELTFSVSATTRPVRGKEIDGKDYHFLSVPDFESKIASGDFVEYEEVYKDVFYGTLKSELERIWSQNRIPVLDIDVIGAMNIKNNYAQGALTVFVHPLSIENLKHRLHKRATETAESFAKRIQKAEEELSMAGKFEKIIYNDNLDNAKERALEFINDYLHVEQKYKL